MVAPEIVSMEEKEDAAACLIANAGVLCGGGRLGEQKSWAGRTNWSDQEPALIFREGCVFDDAEAESLGKESEGFVVIAHQQRDASERLAHGRKLSHEPLLVRA